MINYVDILGNTHAVTLQQLNFSYAPAKGAPVKTGLKLPGAVAVKPFYARATTPSSAALNSPSFARTIAHPVAVPISGSGAVPRVHAVRQSVPPSSHSRALTAGSGNTRIAQGGVSMLRGMFGAY